MVKAEYKLKREDFIPFSNNYIHRLIALREKIGTGRYNHEVKGIYTKVAGLGLIAYDTAIMTLPLWINDIADGLKGLSKLVQG